MRDEYANQAGNALGRIDKTWDECGIEEKVERIRQQLRAHRDVTEYAARSASQALDLSRNHQHGATGEVLKPVNGHGGGSQTGLVGGSGFDPLR